MSVLLRWRSDKVLLMAAALFVGVAAVMAQQQFALARFTPGGGYENQWHSIRKFEYFQPESLPY